MWSTVAAALKKIAVAILTDKKARHKVCIFILTCLVMVIMPIAAVIAIFSGKIEFTPEQLTDIASNIDVVEIAKNIKITAATDVE